MVRQGLLAGGGGALGVLFVLRLLDGSSRALVQAWYDPVLAASGLVLIGLAAVAGARALRSRNGSDVRVTAGGLLTVALVGIPMALGLVFKPEPLGTKSLGTGTAPNRQFSVSAASADPAQRNIFQWAYAFETDDPAEIVGQPVELIGFVYRPDGEGPERFLVARFVVACCVADAQGYALPVLWKEAASLSNDQWVRIEGRVAVGPDGAAIVRAMSVALIEAPSNPYIYP